MEHYPTEELMQKAFWESQLNAAAAFMKPYVEAGVELVKQYNNMPVTNRTKFLEKWTSSGDDTERLKANFIYAWVNQEVASMTSDAEIDVEVKAKKSFAINDTDTVKANAEHWYRETEQIRQDELLALDFHLGPFIIKKIGWHAELDEDEKIKLLDLAENEFPDAESENLYLAEGEPTVVTRDQDQDEHILINSLLLEDDTIPEEIKDLIIKPHIQRHEDFKNEIQPAGYASVKWQAPFGIRWPWDDFLMDPSATQGLNDARWIAFRIRQPVYRWQSNDNYSNTSDLKPNSDIVGDEAISLSGKDRRAYDKKKEKEFDDFGMCEGWEIWARDFPISATKRTNLLVVLVQTHDKLLYHDDWPDEYNALDDYPAVLELPENNLKTWINRPILSMAGADNQQKLIDEFHDSMLYTMRKQKNLYLYDRRVFKEEQVQTILDLPDSSVYGVDGLGDMAGSPVFVWPMNQISQDKEQTLGLIRTIFDQTAGTPEPMRRRSSDTATEAAIVERRVSAREDTRFKKFRRMQADTVRKWWQLQTQFRPDMADLIDPRTKATMEVTEEIARGEYRFEISVAGRETSLAVAQNNAMKLFNLLAGSAPTLMQFGIPVNLQQALEDLIKTFDKDPSRYLPQTSATEYMEAFQQKMNDPAALQEMLLMLSKFPNSGGALGMQAGPINPQQFASNASTEARQTSEAQRLES